MGADIVVQSVRFYATIAPLPFGQPTGDGSALQEALDSPTPFLSEREARMRSVLFPGLVVLALATTLAASAQDAGYSQIPPSSPIAEMRLPTDARLGATAPQVFRALAGVAQPSPIGFRSNGEVSRGVGEGLYNRVAPAVVVIRAKDGFGSGFLISRDGWIVTDAHVVEKPDFRVPDGVRVVKVYLGHLHNGAMMLDQTPIPAVIHKSSEEKDLALLKIAPPPGHRDLTCLTLAERFPSPGGDCVAIGHPRSGMLWTLRSGEIAGVGMWPQDLLQTVMATLTASQAEARNLTKILRAIPQRKVALSTCGINPGDSGGPLVNARGEVIAVTFGIPKNDRLLGISLDKFSYHLHLDELKAFLADRPAEPPPFVPSPWPPAIFSRLVDTNKNKVFDTLLFGTGAGEFLTGFLLDLNESSSPDFDPTKLNDPEMRKLWHFAFAYHRVPMQRTFYDTDNDGKIDLVLTDVDGDGLAEIVLKLESGRWKAAPAKGQKMFDAALFKNAKLRERFHDFEKRLRGTMPFLPGKATEGGRPSRSTPPAQTADPPEPAVKQVKDSHLTQSVRTFHADTSSARNASSPENADIKKYALLVGCTEYPTVHAPTLKGPANDVPLWSKLLREKFGFTSENITTFVGWPDDAKARPTCANITAGFQDLIAKAGRGVQIVILLSGHGSRVPASSASDNPDRMQPDGLETVFLPADTKGWSADATDNIIRHNQFGKWLEELQSKGADVWIVFDCCHAASMSRGGGDGEASRGVNPENLGVPEETLRRTAERANRLQSRAGLEVGRGNTPFQGNPMKFKPPADRKGSLVAFFAAQSWEEAKELRIPEEAPNTDENIFGLMSYTLATRLQQQQCPLSYRQLSQLVAATYRAERGVREPTPGFDGDLDRQVLGTRTWSKKDQLFLLTRNEEGGLQLNAGDIHGITPGSILAVYPPTGQSSGAENVLGYVMVEQKSAEPFRALVCPCAYQGKLAVAAAAIPKAAWCSIVYRDLGDMRIKLAIAPPLDPSDARRTGMTATIGQAVDSLNHEMVEKITDQSKADWILRIVTPEEAKQDFKLIESEPKAFLLQGQKRTALAENAKKAERLRSFGVDNTAKVFGRYPVDDAKNLAAELEIDLPKIFQWQNLWRIASALGPNASEGNDRSVQLEIIKLKNKTDRKGELLRDSVLRSGDFISCRIQNESSEGYWVSLVFVQADFSILVLRSKAVEPGKPYSVPGIKIVADGNNKALASIGPEGVLVLAVPMSASKEPPDFECLAQEPLGRAPQISKGSLGLPDTPFGKLLRYAVTAHGSRGVSLPIEGIGEPISGADHDSLLYGKP